jgi:hypothetical protein
MCIYKRIKLNFFIHTLCRCIFLESCIDISYVWIVCTNICICTYSWMYMYIYIYIYLYVHTNIYTYTYMYINKYIICTHKGHFDDYCLWTQQRPLLKRYVECFGVFIVGLFYYICIFLVCVLTLLLMPLTGLHFFVGLDFVTPSL